MTVRNYLGKVETDSRIVAFTNNSHILGETGNFMVGSSNSTTKGKYIVKKNDKNFLTVEINMYGTVLSIKRYQDNSWVDIKDTLSEKDIKFLVHVINTVNAVCNRIPIN